MFVRPYRFDGVRRRRPLVDIFWDDFDGSRTCNAFAEHFGGVSDQSL